MAEFLNRANQVGRQSESWQPPPHKAITTPLARLEAVARRFLDLQAGSIWKDLVVLLPESRGLVLDVGSGRPTLPASAATGGDLQGYRLCRCQTRLRLLDAGYDVL